jgi:predicted MFS family arabinose efflux permease
MTEKKCLSRLREARWSQVLFGDEPWPILVSLLICGFIFKILGWHYLPAVIVLVILALLAHAWLWCHTPPEDDREEAAQSKRDDA